MLYDFIMVIIIVLFIMILEVHSKILVSSQAFRFTSVTNISNTLK